MTVQHVTSTKAGRPSSATFPGGGCRRKKWKRPHEQAVCMHESPRCTATSKRTRERCRAPAVTGWKVCRFHGAGGGGPKGETEWRTSRDDSRPRPRRSSRDLRAGSPSSKVGSRNLSRSRRAGKRARAQTGRAVAHSGSGSTFRIGFAAGSIPTLYPGRPAGCGRSRRGPVVPWSRQGRRQGQEG